MPLLETDVHSLHGNPQNGGPRLTERRYHYNGSRYVTVGLSGLFMVRFWVRVRVRLPNPKP